MMRRTHDVLLGPETDEALFERLVATVQAWGGSVEHADWALAGSQEVDTWIVRLPEGELRAVAETYEGLTLRGPEPLVSRLAAAVLSTPSAPQGDA